MIFFMNYVMSWGFLSGRISCLPCAAYPEYENFLDNVAVEVAQNVIRIQYHPSIAIWCGNNENEWIWFQAHKESYKENAWIQNLSRFNTRYIKKA